MALTRMQIEQLLDENRDHECDGYGDNRICVKIVATCGTALPIWPFPRRGLHERERAPVPENASWTTPEEIAAMILYLCSEDARIVNGARIPMYGVP